MKEDQPYQDKHRQHAGHGVAYDVFHKWRSMDLVLLRNGFNHEIGTISDIGTGAEKHGAHANRDNQFRDRGISQQ